MAQVLNERMSVAIEGDFVVFLIGMRVNKPWKIHRWLPVFTAMPSMLAELSKKPELGLLGYRLVLGSDGPTVIQYWRSVEQLQAYARADGSAHLPAWRKFRASVGDSGDVGIWHETYLVGEGRYEAIYANMPRVGLATAGEHVPVAQLGNTAARRLGHTSTPAPVAD